MSAEPTYDVFISNSIKDRRWVSRLESRLGALRNPTTGRALQIFTAPAKLQPGDKWLQALETIFSRAKAIIFVLSPNFLGSEFCLHEWQWFFTGGEKEKQLALPCLITDVTLPPSMSNYQYIDFRKPRRYERGIAVLIERLRQHLRTEMYVDTIVTIADLGGRVYSKYPTSITLDEILRNTLRRAGLLRRYHDFFEGPLEISIQRREVKGSQRLQEFVSHPSRPVRVRFRGGGKKCVADTTLILLPGGTQAPIKEIQVGARVVGWDFRTERHKKGRVVSIIAGEVPTAVVLNESLVASRFECLVTEEGVTPVTAIKPGDRLRTPEGGFEVVRTRRRLVRGRIAVRSMIVEPCGTFCGNGIVIEDLIGGAWVRP